VHATASHQSTSLTKLHQNLLSNPLSVRTFKIAKWQLRFPQTYYESVNKTKTWFTKATAIQFAGPKVYTGQLHPAGNYSSTIKRHKDRVAI
jgi:hypothetical protein